MPSLKLLSMRFLEAPEVSPQDLVFVCPRLKMLAYLCIPFIGVPHTARSINIPNVLVLEAFAATNPANYEDEIACILKRSPYLRKLYLSHGQLKVLQVVKAHCSSISTVIVNVKDGWEIFQSSVVCAATEENERSSGIRFLAVEIDEQTAYQQAFINPLIEKNKDALRTLILRYRVPMWCTLDLGRIAAEQLSTIELSMFPRSSTREVASFVRQCPSISRISIIRGEILDTAEIFEALMLSTCLSDFYIEKTSIHTDGFNHLLEHHDRLGTKSKLKYVSIDYTPGINDLSLRILASLSYLKHIRVNSCPAVSASGLQLFIVGLVETRRVMRLELGDLAGLNASLIPRTGEMQTLRVLVLGTLFGDSLHVDDDAIAKLIKKAPRLESLTVQRCPNVTKSVWRNILNMGVTTEIYLEGYYY